MPESARLIKKYPNRRLYDTKTSTYITLADVKQLVLQNEAFQVVDAKSSEDLTRQPLQPTLEFARRLSGLGRPMWVRFTLVPGLTDAPDNVEKLADICAGLETMERVEIQPFHQMGREKWHRLGLSYPLEKVEPPGAELIDRVRGQFRSRGLTVY